MAIVLESIKGYIEGNNSGYSQQLTKVTNTFGGMQGPRVDIIQLQGRIGDKGSEIWFFDRVEEGQGGDVPTYRRNGRRYYQEGFLAGVLHIHYRNVN